MPSPAAQISKTLAKRYPGSQPFKREQWPVFFGRQKDNDDLFRTISVNELTVLYGESGLGKSSLLNAGVMPRFAKMGVKIAFPRFFGYDQKDHVNPLGSILTQLRPLAQEVDSKGNVIAETIFMSQVQGDPKKQTLWQQIKSIQLHQQRKGATGLILVFDQFEELFSYGSDPRLKLVEEFGRQFGELLDNRMPEEFRKDFYGAINQNASDPGTPEEMAFLDRPLPLKVVLGIRFDRLGLLKGLSPYYAHILLDQNLFRLLALDRQQARQAIVNPAEFVYTSDPDNPDDKPLEFEKPVFHYTDETLDAILDYLTDHDRKPVETTQLQVICQHVENNMIKAGVEGQIVQRDQLGDIELIAQKYYDNVIASLPVAEQGRVRTMVEDNMIFEKDQIRLPLYESQVLNTYQISRETLNALVSEHHLLRVEERSSGFIYEISHDSLVPPILASKKIRLAEIARQQEEAERLQAEAEAARLKAKADEDERKRKEEQQEKERQERLRQQNRANFRFALVAGTLFVVASIFASVAYYQNGQAKAARNLALEKSQLAEEQRLIAEQNAVKAQVERDSAVALRAQLSAETYKNRYEQGKLLMEQNKFADALPNFVEALKIDAPERNTAELNNLINACRIGAGKEISYRDLMREADELRDQKKYLDAYPVYQRALALNFDNKAVQQSLNFCESELLNQLSNELRRAETFQKEGKDCGDASQAIRDYVDPILTMLNLPLKNDLRIKRDKIWKACR